MAKKSNPNIKIVGLVLLVVGLGLAFWGYQMSGSIESQLTRTFSGSSPDKVMMLYIGGATSFAVGLFLFFRK